MVFQVNMAMSCNYLMSRRYIDGKSMVRWILCQDYQDIMIKILTEHFLVIVDTRNRRIKFYLLPVQSQRCVDEFMFFK